MQPLRLLGPVVGLSLLTLSLSCSKAPVNPVASAAPAPPLGALIPAGPLQTDHIQYQFAIYYLPLPTKEPLAELDALLMARPGTFARVETIEGEEKSPTLSADLEADPQANYPPPDAQSLQYFGRGLSKEQAAALQETQQALLLNFSYESAHAWSGMRAALETTHALALATGGVLWDEATREIFTSAEWQQRRLTNWSGDVPDVSKHTVIHAYPKEKFARAITLGMEKFGLPDIVAENFSWSENRNVGITINLFAQSIAEGATVARAGEFDLDVSAIKNAEVREPQLASLKDRATGIALLNLHEGIAEEGDPANRLVEITFERWSGPDGHARREQALSSAFGTVDEVSLVKHDEQLEKLSQQAKQQLPKLQAEFNQGLAPGEFLQVKVPFATPSGGREWMWVEVSTWQGDKITGLLKNEPRDIPTLHAGQVVTVSATDTFDYIRKHADGKTEGNETGKLIEKK